MGKLIEQKFFKGKSTNDQKTHKEMLKIPGHKGNKNHIKNHTSSLLEWLSPRTQTNGVVFNHREE
jgi:hypothetical protein